MYSHLSFPMVLLQMKLRLRNVLIIGSHSWKTVHLFSQKPMLSPLNHTANMCSMSRLPGCNNVIYTYINKRQTEWQIEALEQTHGSTGFNTMYLPCSLPFASLFSLVALVRMVRVNSWFPGDHECIEQMFLGDFYLVLLIPASLLNLLQMKMFD